MGEDAGAFAGPRCGRLKVYPSFLGFGLYWAWLWLLFFTDVLVPFGRVGFAEVSATRSLAFAVEALVFLAFVLNMVKKDPIVLRHGADNAVICLLGGLGTIGIILFGVVELPGGVALCVASWVMWGIAGAFLTVLWSRIFDSLNVTGICFYVAGSMALGAFIVYVLTYMPIGFTGMMAVALPLLSTLFAHHAKNVIRGDSFEGKIPLAPVTDPVIVPKPLMRILLGVMAYSLALGFALCMATSQEGGGFDASNRAALAAPLAVGIALAAFSYLRNDVKAVAVLYRFALPAMVIGFLTLAYEDAGHSAVACFAVVVGFQCFDAVVAVILFQGSRHFEHLSIRSFAMGRVANALGLSVGWAFGLAVANGFLPGLADLSMLYLVIAAVLVAFSSFLLLERDLFPGEEPALNKGRLLEPSDTSRRGPMGIDAAIARIAKDAGLSAQEARVFAYLAKGHSRKTIQEKLFIASATVDTHARHVYRKLGIKSRQELIDLVAAEAERVCA